MLKGSLSERFDKKDGNYSFEISKKRYDSRLIKYFN